MNNFIRLLLIFIGIWAVASFLNGICSGIALGGALDIACLASFILSIPFVFITWLIITLICLTGCRGEELYRATLQVSFFVSIGAVVFINTFFPYELRLANIAISICIIISSVASIIIFREKLKSIE